VQVGGVAAVMFAVRSGTSQRDEPRCARKRQA
jgi:hypothetical protein